MRDKEQMTVGKLAPLHPGEVLFEEFMKPMGLSQNRLGRDLGVTPRRINEIIHGKRGVTADSALRLARYFGTSARFWMGLQSDYDLETAEDKLSEKITNEVKLSQQVGRVNSERIPSEA
jgi:addiction module HigA family antidote